MSRLGKVTKGHRLVQTQVVCYEPGYQADASLGDQPVSLPFSVLTTDIRLL